MNSQNDKETSKRVKSAVINIMFALFFTSLICVFSLFVTTTTIEKMAHHNSSSPTLTPIALVPTWTATFSAESSPVEIAVLNINSETQSNGTINNTASLSISPLGIGTLQLTSPSTIKFGESSVIRLTITPDSVLANLPRVAAPTVSTNAPEYVLEFSDRLQIYPVMIAELKGVKFEIESDNRPEKPVVSTMPVEWIWNVTPLSAGKQTLILAISIPVIVDQTRNVVSAQTLKNIPIEIQVEITPTPIPSKTPTPLPPIARIGEKLIENVTAITVAVIGLIGALAGVYVTYINAKKNEGTTSSTKKAKTK